MTSERDDLTLAMRQVLLRIAKAGRPPFHALPPLQARALYAAGAEVLEPPAPAVSRVEHLTALARDGVSLPLTCWTPVENPVATAVTGAPALLYLHGGGFTIGSPTTHGQLCQRLAAWSGCHVLALDYRLAPEHTFPTAHHDAWDALQWLHHQAPALGLDPHRLAVGGDSAGGTLAAYCALMARDHGLPLRMQMLFYPGCVADQRLPSHTRYAKGYLLDAESIDYFYGNYLNQASDRLDWRFSPVLAPEHEGLAPVWMGLAECDPLIDEGLAYADQLRMSRVNVDLHIYRGVVHGFIQMGRALPEALEAVHSAAHALHQAMTDDNA
jgi:acetyl esterase